MAKYLIIKNIEILKANANPVWYIVAPPAMTAYHGFIQALLLDLINTEELYDSAPGLALHEGFSVIHHEIQMLGSLQNTKYGNIYFPNQISSAGAYDKDDYVKQSTNIASQPTATCNLLIDLVIRLPENLIEIDIEKIKQFLYRANIAGGKINGANKAMDVSVTDNYSKLLNKLVTGFYIKDRHDLLIKSEGDSSSDTPLDRLLKKTRELDNKAWLVPSSVGYLCLTEFEQRDNSRTGNQVAYAEPVVTLTEYVPVRKESDIPFWNWTKQNLNEKKLFILKGEVK